MQVPYQVGIGPASGAAPTLTLSIFDSWTLSRNLDDGCSFSFSCPGDSFVGAAISELDTDVWVYQDSVLIDRFRIAEVQQTWNADGRDDVSISAVCYRRILASRFVVSPLSYTATSQGTIVWNLISHTQAQTNGSLGITLGSSGPATLRTRSYDVGQNILEAITDLGTIAGGIVWDIDGSRVLTVRTADQFPVQPQPAVLGVNVDGLSRPSGAARFANVAIVSGDAIATTLQITPAPTLGVDPRGRWERYAGFPSETTQTALQQAANGIIETSQSPAVIWSLSLVPDRYWTDSAYGLGDFITIVPPLTTVAPLGPSVPVEAQIITQEITISADGEAVVTMTAIETPHPPAPTVVTNAATSFTTTGATLNGDLTVATGVVSARGFVFSSTNPVPTIGGGDVTQVIVAGTGAGAFSSAETGLTPDTIYYYQAFTVSTSGTSYGGVQTFVTGVTFDYFVLGGGGGGGVTTDRTAGGGGGGGFRTGTLTLARGTLASTTVGAGGGGATNGSASQWSTITSLGGGRGGGTTGGANGASGGSGGGGKHSGTGGAGTVGQGNAGGNGHDSGNISLMFGGGGGGGPAGVGGNASSITTQLAGIGGASNTNDYNGGNLGYGGGGGGSAQRGPSASTYNRGVGSVGGGNGALAQTEAYASPVVIFNPQSGAANRGGGGGGQARAGSAGATSTVGSGGSGRVVVRYLASLPTLTIPGGLTYSTGTYTIGATLYRYYDFTAGTGSVTI